MREGSEHCRRVLRISNGWTTKVATVPAVNPAVDSMSEDDRLLALPSIGIGGTTLGMLI